MFTASGPFDFPPQNPPAPLETDARGSLGISHQGTGGVERAGTGATRLMVCGSSRADAHPLTDDGEQLRNATVRGRATDSRGDGGGVSPFPGLRWKQHRKLLLGRLEHGRMSGQAPNFQLVEQAEVPTRRDEVAQGPVANGTGRQANSCPEVARPPQRVHQTVDRVDDEYGRHYVVANIICTSTRREIEKKDAAAIVAEIEEWTQ